jgi:hypothetical protein
MAALERERTGPWQLAGVTAVCAASGLLASAADVDPTESSGANRWLAAGFGLAVAWGAAGSPWWALVVAGLVTAATGFAPLPIFAGIVAVVGGATLGVLRRDVPLAGAAIGLLLVQGLLALELDAFHGASALVAAAVAVFLVGTGVLYRTERGAVLGLAALVLVGIAAAAAFIGFVVALGLSFLDLRNAEASTRSGLQAVDSGNPEQAAADLREASAALDGVAERFDAWWAKPAAWLPVVSQHRALVQEFTTAAGEATGNAAEAVTTVDLASLAPVDGVVDLAKLAALTPALVNLDTALDGVSDVATRDRSPWIIGPVQSSLDRLDERTVEAQQRIAQARRVTAAAPAMLGANEPRRYLLLSTATPGEAGPFGPVAGFTELAVEQGRISVVRAGTGADLAAAAVSGGAPGAWDTVNAAANTPAAASEVARIYAASGGTAPIDGVVFADADGIGELVRAVGPLPVPGLNDTLTAEVLAARLEAAAEVQRADILAVATGALAARLVTGALPDPGELGSAIGATLDRGHLAMWASRPDEQRLLADLGADGLSIKVPDEPTSLTAATTLPPETTAAPPSSEVPTSAPG